MKTETAARAPNICVVEDDMVVAESLRQRLTIEGFAVDLYDRAYKAYDGIRSKRFDVMLCDIRLPDMGGDALFRKLLQEQKIVPPTIFMTAYGAIDHAVALLKLGAADYITKPFEPEALISKLKFVSGSRAKAGIETEADELGISPEMRALQGQLGRLARYHDTPLLITGESGAGKEVVARFLHLRQKSPGRFVAINCSALPEHLIESELFGHEKGAFTGASKLHKGVFEQASDGTLLLDEIGDMPLHLQAKLLRVMQERTVKRVGGEEDIAVRQRLVFATNRNLEQLVEAGEFREDLYFRINVIHIEVPPLRLRRDDIIWLAQRFIGAHCRNYPGAAIALQESAVQALLDHSWPGNVRELKHAIERACILCGDDGIAAQDVFGAGPLREHDGGDKPLRRCVEELEKDKIASALAVHQGCMTKTAAHLGISRKSLWEKMRKYRIDRST